MSDRDKTRDQLVEELQNLRAVLARLQGTGAPPGARDLPPDVGEREAAAAALRAAEERYRLLFEGNLAAVVHARWDGRLIDCNTAYAGLLGYASREEILARPAWDHYFRREDRVALLEELRRRGQLRDHELHLRRKDGRPVWVLANLNLLPGDGPEPALQGILLDITERKRSEARRRQAQKMEAVGRLAGGVAHDFNNMLTVILGYSELLLDELGPADPRRLAAREIRQAADRAAELTGQLLAFGRRSILAPRVLDLNRFLRDQEKVVARLLGGGINLTLDLHPDLGAVRADPEQLEQVLLNLAVNARDAMPHGGRLTVETRNVDLGEAQARQHPEVLPGPYVCLTVRDGGEGMTEEVRSHLFEPFFTTKGQGKGTGLGLAVVYGIVLQSGGTIEADSAPGAGTTFRIYLPRVAAEAASAEPAPAPDLPRSSETVLLAEDEVMVRRYAATVLRSQGYTVLEAADGLEAVRLFEGHPGPVHLLATDLEMPGMGGRDLAQRLTAQRPGLKVLFLSGYTPDAHLRQGGWRDEASFLHKPFTPEALAHKVREILDR